MGVTIHSAGDRACASDASNRRDVSVVMTIKNDSMGLTQTLDSLVQQARLPDDIVIVDGGSSDGTLDVAKVFAETHPMARVVIAPGANIARGRNIGVADASGEIIATIDAGCRADPYWLANLIAPFERDPQIEFVAGIYRIEPRNLFEQVVGLATMRGQLEPFNPARFNPSARSMALTKSLWQRAGGWPEWVDFSEDTLFDLKLRAMGAEPYFAGDAVVHWRPRTSLRSVARQFYGYGTGRGQTQIESEQIHYNLRNFAMIAACTIGLAFSWWAFVPLLAFATYFYVYAFHNRAIKIVRRTRHRIAYPLCMVVMWTVLASHTMGFVVGTLRRWRGGNTLAKLRESYFPTHIQKHAGT